MNIKQYSQDHINIEMPAMSATEVVTQYGMRYPDGTVKWVYDHTPTGGSIHFKDLAGEHGDTRERWNDRLERRAAACNIPLDEYFEGHHLIQRMIIVAVTEAEDVA